MIALLTVGMKNEASRHAIKLRSKAKIQIKVSGKKILSAPFSYYFLVSASKHSRCFKPSFYSEIYFSSV